MSREIVTPYFTLMCEFEYKGNFAGYIEYIAREEAQESNQKEVSDRADFEFENSKLNMEQDKFFRYLNYMDRQSALESKAKLTKEEIESLQRVMEENKEMVEMLKRMRESTTKSNPKEKLQTGMFDFHQDDLSSAEVEKYKQKFHEAEKADSILYKDVISFKTEALIVAGIYNPYKDELNRKPLIEASRKMLKQMYQDEKLEQTGISVGEIHYNTNHIHIHFATVETENTRGTIFNPETGVKETRGLRKESTFQNMKSAFANYVFDRSEELEKISNLRDTLRSEIKDQLHARDDDKAMHYLSELKSNLPEDKSKWNSKNLSKENQGTMRKLIDELMKDNPSFHQYKQSAKEENDFKMQTYGKLPEGQTSFYEGRMEGRGGIYYRLSNSIMEELRKDSLHADKNKRILKSAFQKNPDSKKFQKQKNDFNLKDFQQQQQNNFLKQDVNKIIQNNGRSNGSVVKQLKRLERATNNEFEKYKAELENEKIAHAIRQAQYEQSFE